MKAIMVMFDSLNRRMLPPYGCDWVHAPNFTRLAERTATFENYYIGSMPCMPARRELHTGRYNFLHRSWGPIEPFDNSMPEMLKRLGIYTHLATDHQHYFEDGGSTYHNRYNTWHFSRGQEGDAWIGQVADPEIPHKPKKTVVQGYRQDWVNRQVIQNEADFPQARTFANGLDFIRRNHEQDNWFLQIETFDPHEPFYTPQKFKDLYPHDYDGPILDWPDYNIVTETPEEVDHLRYEYAALVSMCDHHLGLVLDLMDELELWDDTLLIVNTDHGFLLGEHGSWAKNFQPLYNEIANIPLFIWDPRSRVRAELRHSLVQMIDLPATLLEYFGVPIPEEMLGLPLTETIASDQPVRQAALFGYFGRHINVTDGRYVYMRAPMRPENNPLYEYTLMPTHLKSLFSIEEMRELELAAAFDFTKGCRTMKIPGHGSLGSINPFMWGTLLFDLERDPNQESPIVDHPVEARMLELLLDGLRRNDAPPEQYTRLGLPETGPADKRHLALAKIENSQDTIGLTPVEWSGSAKKMFYTLVDMLPFWMRRQFIHAIEAAYLQEPGRTLDEKEILALGLQAAPQEHRDKMSLLARIVLEKGELS
jgi:arylsulfatase A-like enzyme